MIEASENIDLVTIRRQQELQRAKESYRKTVAEGRLAVKPRTQEPAQMVVTHAPIGAGAEQVGQTVQSRELQPVSAPPANPETTWRHTRIAITAGLVVVLLVVWIWQKKSGR